MLDNTTNPMTYDIGTIISKNCQFLDNFQFEYTLDCLKLKGLEYVHHSNFGLFIYSNDFSNDNHTHRYPFQ